MIDMRTSDANALPFEPLGIVIHWRVVGEHGFEMSINPNEAMPSLRPMLSQIFKQADDMRGAILGQSLSYQDLSDFLNQVARLLQEDERRKEALNLETMILATASILVLIGDGMTDPEEGTGVNLMRPGKPTDEDIIVEPRVLH